MAKEKEPAAAEAAAGQEELKKQLEECQKKAEEYLAGWQRARADLLNYKKEQDLAIKAVVSFEIAGLIRKILAVLHSFDLAEKEISEELKNNNEVKGLLQIKKQISDFLQKEGVETIEVKEGKDMFNPSVHEIVEQIEKGGMEPGTIIEEVRRGYIKDNRIIVPAKVKVVK
jgi:molecular chaperone GrpE